MQKLVIILLTLVFLFALPVAFAQTNPTGFTDPTTVNTSGGNSTTPQLVVSGNNVYLAWVDDRSGKYDILFDKSKDGGNSFGKTVNLSQINSGAADNLRIGQSNENVYAVWQSLSAKRSSIQFAKSTDQGDSFSPPITISEISKDSAYPEITTSGNHVYATWYQRTSGDITNIVFSKSDDSGITFSKPISITNHNGSSGIPKLAAEGNDVYITWEDNSSGKFDVYICKSGDNGNTFSLPVNVSNNKGDSGTPEIIVKGNNVYLVWMDNTNGNFDILFSKSSDGGNTFSSPVNLSNNERDSGYPQFDVAGNEVYVAWTNQVSDQNYDILFSKSSDGGETFGPVTNLSNNQGASGWPQVSVTGNVYVSWVDNTPGNFEVYVTKSSDDGKTFVTPVNISNNPRESWYSRMIVSPSTVYMAWQQENKENGHDIIFTKSTTFVPEFGPVASAVLIIGIISIVAITKGSMLKKLYLVRF